MKKPLGGLSKLCFLTFSWNDVLVLLFFKSGEGWSFQVCCVENDAILEGVESTW